VPHLVQWLAVRGGSSRSSRSSRSAAFTCLGVLLAFSTASRTRQVRVNACVHRVCFEQDAAAAACALCLVCSPFCVAAKRGVTKYFAVEPIQGRLHGKATRTGFPGPDRFLGQARKVHPSRFPRWIEVFFVCECCMRACVFVYA